MNINNSKMLSSYRETNFTFEDKIILVLYSIYFILKPFYFWSSGLPQISDFIFVLLMIIFLMVKRTTFLKITNKQLILWACLFVFYSVAVNLIWSIILSTSDMLLPSIYLIYNLLVYLLVFIMIKIYGMKLIEVSFYSSYISILIQTLYLVIQGGFLGTRNTGAFNNPNQLGYYGLLMGSFFVFCSNKKNINKVIIGLLLGLILVFTSLSKAAILSYIGLISVYLVINFFNKETAKKIIISLLLLFGVSLLVDYTTDFLQESILLESVENRISGIGNDNDDSLEGRGYDRITNYPKYWLFGAGEGEFARFSGFLSGFELHSTLANIQVSYGIIGLLFFLLFLYRVIKQDTSKNVLIILFIMLYGLTHNGLRNSLFWILLSMMSFDTTNLTNLK